MAVSRKTKLVLGVAALAVLGAIAFLAFGWFEVQQLWLDDEVNEELTTFREPADPDGSTATAEPGEPDGATPVPETTAPAEPVLVRAGSFTGVEGHRAAGEVNLIRHPDGSHIVQFPDLDADNGPDLVVWLTTADDTSTPVVDLGELKGNQGAQEYTVPAGTSLDDVATVVIWCRRFSVGFAEAPLSS